MSPDQRNRADLSRRQVVGSLAAASAAAFVPRLMPAQESEILRRPIPSTDETLPVMGLGTWQTFDVGSSEGERGPLRTVLRDFAAGGGTLVDSSPMYGRSETVVGDLSAELHLRDTLFFATKVWTRGRGAGVEQMNQSLRRMRADPMDLMQVHNLLDVDTHLNTLRAWKDEGRVRYVGVTHYQTSAFRELERLIQSKHLDFVQCNYSIATRAAETSLLPMAADHGVATIINRPYESGGLFRRVRGKSLPGWAAEFDCRSWGQFFLKYIVADPNVTCVIPATSDPGHLQDNMMAGSGRLPDAALRRRMVEFMARV